MAKTTKDEECSVPKLIHVQIFVMSWIEKIFFWPICPSPTLV